MKLRVKDFQVPKEPEVVEVKTPPPKPKPKPNEFNFEMESFADLAELDMPEPNWFVKDILCEGLTMLAGDAKVGKTFFAINLGLAMAEGGIALGEKEVPKPYNVVYLALDDNKRRMVNRVKRLSDRGIPRNFHCINKFPYKFIGKPFEAFGEFLVENETDFLIVDTWTIVEPAAPPVSNSSSYKDDYYTVSKVKEFFEALGISVMAITHTTKNKDYENPFQAFQGSTGIQGACDNMILLKRESGGVTLHTNGNDVLEEEYAISFDKGTFVWTIEGDAEEVRRSQPQQELLVLLRDAGAKGAKQGDLAEAVHKATSTVGETLRLMASKGLVVREGDRGKWYYNDDGIPL